MGILTDHCLLIWTLSLCLSEFYPHLTRGYMESLRHQYLVDGVQALTSAFLSPFSLEVRPCVRGIAGGLRQGADYQASCNEACRFLQNL